MRLLGLVFFAVMLCSSTAPLASASAQEDYTLFVSVDETKVSIESGNLTVGVVTSDWPRLVFWHTVDPFSPTFDIGIPTLYLFNDTDGDGRFCRAETLCTVYLDSNHVEWNRSTVRSDYSVTAGESVMFSMEATTHAYNATSETTPSVQDWANVTLWFCLAENELEYENPAGPHVVSGKTSLFMNITIDVNNRTDFQMLAIETFVQGGATTNSFHILEDGDDGEVSAVLSARVDETTGSDEFTRPMNSTTSPVQCIDLAKEDGTVQAFYDWDSVARNGSGDVDGVMVNSSCYTTGIGLVLHSAMNLTNDTMSISVGSSLGLIESGFVGTMTDWVREHSSTVIAMTIAAAAVVVVLIHIALRRRRKKKGDRQENDAASTGV